MQLLYLACLLVGGSFVFLAAIGGIDGADFHHDFGDFHHDFDADWETVPGKALEGNGTAKALRRKPGFWLRKLGQPFTSVRFWTFGSCFFGLTGVVLSHFTNLAPLTIASFAVAMGIVCGTAMVWALRILQFSQSDSMVRNADIIGLSATVEIPFDATSKGKVRLNVKGSGIDFVAFTEESQGFQKGEKVFIVGIKNNQLWVVSQSDLRKLEN
ncbi:MAG TPA: NfeD family protein [Oscillatoriaceae cyanobacterium M33_DOE_052]|uniref:NfeD-like protein n=1 Tax=Planktothricoides sp. SpSt-374 TaxID=2282167 RepID=A0A7C3ZI41_9CYAN|nr:NfeD family protein [Oscillatoriaceae cyanobacterium M33_DOE_052]